MDCVPNDGESIALWLSAIGTVAVAVMAIWGDWVRSRLVPPKADLQEHNTRGSVERFPDGVKAIYYHLRVANQRRWMPLKNCRVFLTQVQRRTPDGRFKPIPLPVPLQMMWAPSEFSATVQTIDSYRIIDFGFLVEGSDKFQPSLYVTPYAFQGFVRKDEAVRYVYQIMSDNMTSEEMIYEVAWNGEWCQNLDEMEHCLTIKRVKE